VYKNVIGNALQYGESLKTETCWSDIIESSSGVGEFGLELLDDGCCLTLNILSLARQRCLPSWGPRRTPWVFFVVGGGVISQLFDAVDYSNYVFWVSETIIQ
jgi:hypothetical protein